MRAPSCQEGVSRARGLIAVAGALSLAIAGMGVLSGSRAMAQESPSRAAAFVDDAAALSDTTRAREDRVAAARRLVLSQHPDARARIAQALAGRVMGDASGAVVAEALASIADAPAWAGVLLVDRLKAADGPEVPILLGALASARTREAARAILPFTAPPKDATTVEAACNALARLTGRDDLPKTHAAWEAFLAEADRWSESAWRANLLKALAERADRLGAQSRATADRLAESLRRTYVAMPEPDRPKMLASLLSDPLDAARQVGFELASRELAASKTLGPEVADAAERLLSHPDAPTRSAAAGLVALLASPRAGDVLAAALQAERDPLTAGAMLDACARFPTRAMAPVVLRWLSADESTARAALAAAWALQRAGHLSNDDRASLLARLRAMPNESLSSAGCSLLASIGDHEDRDRLVPLLRAGSPGVRAAVARSLVGEAGYLDAIVAAASAEPGLFPFAARAMLLHAPDLAGFERLRQLPASSPAVRREGRLLVARALVATDLLEAARSAAEASERDELLGLLVLEDRIMSERASPEQARAIVEGAKQLAAIHLGNARPDDALATLDAVAPIASDADRPALEALQVPALLVLNRIELAEKIPAKPDAWLRGLSMSLDKPHARDVADALLVRYAGELTDDEMTEWSRLRDRIGGTTANGSSDR